MKLLKNISIGIVILFAAIGFILSAGYMAIKLKLTNNKGGVDVNDRFFTHASKLNTVQAKKTISFKEASQVFTQLEILNHFYPINAQAILQMLNESGQILQVQMMIHALTPYLLNNTDYTSHLKNPTAPYTNHPNDTSNLFLWANTDAWKSIKKFIINDAAVIDSAAKLSGVEPRLIVSCLICEQIRLYNSRREDVKRMLAPLRALTVQSVFSLGVTGIKAETAIKVEKNLKDTASPYYCGKKYQNLLDIIASKPDTFRIQKLTDWHNHFYSYLYTGLILRQTMLQWKRSGYDISERPDVLATLYNVGFPFSKPKAQPQVGGSHIKVDGTLYTFGSLAYEFYYSGELAQQFPFIRNKW